MKEVKSSYPVKLSRMNFFLSVILVLLVIAVVHTSIYATTPVKARKYPTQDTPNISVNRTNLNYGAIKEGNMTSTATSSQKILISNTGGGTLYWNVNVNDDWLICYPRSGTDKGTCTVAVAPCELPFGHYSGTITVNDSQNPNVSPQQVLVDLDVKKPSQDQPPFGTFETPEPGSKVSSSIPVTGWVLDDVEVDNVKIYNGNQYVGDAVFVEGARPDVGQSYPDYPLNYQAGWGYMMLTNFLPNGGNGTYNIKAVATDSEGNQTTLGTKTIYCDNEHAVKPFGALDTPTQGGAASGDNYLNWGWALTPMPKYIPKDGSTINVWVNGENLGHPTYNKYREDISRYFPGYSNSDGAAGLFQFDTTGYADGVYTIQWTATDNEGSTDGIGSRYFTINNPDYRSSTNTADASQRHMFSPTRIRQIKNLPVDQRTPVRMKKGFEKNSESQEIFPDEDGLIKIEMKELDRIELDLSADFTGNANISGYLLVGDQFQPLPTGSTLRNSVFYWMPGLAFFGQYRLVFIGQGPGGHLNRMDILVNIGYKFQ